MATYVLTNKLLDTETLDGLRRQMSVAWLRPISCRPEWRDIYMLWGMNHANVFTATRARVIVAANNYPNDQPGY